MLIAMVGHVIINIFFIIIILSCQGANNTSRLLIDLIAACFYTTQHVGNIAWYTDNTHFELSQLIESLRRHWLSVYKLVCNVWRTSHEAGIKFGS